MSYNIQDPTPNHYALMSYTGPNRTQQDPTPNPCPLGVYRAVEEASECGTAVPDPNIEIANLIHEQLALNKDLGVVVNSVLDIVSPAP